MQVIPSLVSVLHCCPLASSSVHYSLLGLPSLNELRQWGMSSHDSADSNTLLFAPDSHAQLKGLVTSKNLSSPRQPHPSPVPLHCTFKLRISRSLNRSWNTWISSKHIKELATTSFQWQLKVGGTGIPCFSSRLHHPVGNKDSLSYEIENWTARQPY